MSAAKPRLRADLESVEIDGEVIVYDPVTASVHHLNPTASAIVGLFDGTATIRSVSGELAETYATPADELEPQVRILVRQLRKLRLLEPAR